MGNRIVVACELLELARVVVGVVAATGMADVVVAVDDFDAGVNDNDIVTLLLLLLSPLLVDDEDVVAVVLVVFMPSMGLLFYYYTLNCCAAHDFRSSAPMIS